jgi:murein DD-endopeptidase MepM/ murein hydrolase activator NlpD
MPKPSPINDTVIMVAPPEREARLESRTVPGGGFQLASADARGGLEGVLARLHASLDRVETRQMATLSSIEETFDAKAKKMRGVLADLGLDMGKVAPAPPKPRATGGPFVPANGPLAAAEFERQIYRINLARAQVERLNRTIVAVPLRRPLTGDIETTSGFGVRVDPFLRSPAMHTGLDFRGDTGDAVRVTANGTVSHAGWNGGYGKMVEVDHGNGFSTRYAHLSAIDVTVGQNVRIGQVVGRLGSTGRSTGPHLHYETRVDGDAVDPQKFLRAGVRLGEKL